MITLGRGQAAQMCVVNQQAYKIREAKQLHTVTFRLRSIWTLLKMTIGININTVSLMMLETPKYVQNEYYVLISTEKLQP